MKKLFGQISFVTVIVMAVSVASAQTQIRPNNQCRQVNGTNQKVCWQPLAGHQPGKMEYPVDGNYWHKMLGVNRGLAFYVSDNEFGAQNTRYIGTLANGHHLYEETTCTNGQCSLPLKVVVDQNNNEIQRYY